jgi:hypothetical protein
MGELLPCTSSANQNETDSWEHGFAEKLHNECHFAFFAFTNGGQGYAEEGENPEDDKTPTLLLYYLIYVVTLMKYDIIFLLSSLSS